MISQRKRSRAVYIQTQSELLWFERCGRRAVNKLMSVS